MNGTTSITRFLCDDDNIENLRNAHPDGLTFVVGDTHGEFETLRQLLRKIRFDPERDHVFFVGDYNEGGDVRQLLKLLSQHYEADCRKPGFHLIRGNHELELCPLYPLENLPDIFVIRGNVLNYWVAHAGMISAVYNLILADLHRNPDQRVLAYRLDRSTTLRDAPFRQIIWSRNGLYTRQSRQVWPSEAMLLEDRSCIIHGHTPYCFFCSEARPGYGKRCLFWERQHVWFSEDLQSFDVDSDVKGRCAYGQTYRGLSCLCLEALDEAAAACGGRLTVDDLRNGRNAVFSAELHSNRPPVPAGDLRAITEAAPEMKTISIDADGYAVFLQRRIIRKQ